ncbi:hypothetical protein NC651_014413 [Populus alba x Populus x berolinensis]|nr:hypothetical protein NC651_014413 [Populus alba x Populus x berolinensis]
MTPPPGPYSGASSLALVARASAFSFGLVYGSVKLKILKVATSILTCLTFLDYPDLFLLWFKFDSQLKMMKANSHKKAEAKAHH